jgi:hypothetical protein
MIGHRKPAEESYLPQAWALAAVEAGGGCVYIKIPIAPR